jgi:hypothetical protein
MPLIATPRRRQIAMAVLIALAIAGGVIRHYASSPSMLRDVGTLLMVMWLPAIGNLISWVVRKLPRSAAPPTDFDQGSTFQPHLRVQLASVPQAGDVLDSLDPLLQLAVVLVGRHGFTARAAVPVAQWLRSTDGQTLELEFLRPETALKALTPGTEFHVLVGNVGVARGRVLG